MYEESSLFWKMYLFVFFKGLIDVLDFIKMWRVIVLFLGSDGDLWERENV